MAGVFQERKTSCAYQTSEINNSTLKAAKLGENKYFTIRMVLVQHSKIISLESQFSETVFFLNINQQSWWQSTQENVTSQDS